MQFLILMVGVQIRGARLYLVRDIALLESRRRRRLACLGLTHQLPLVWSAHQCSVALLFSFRAQIALPQLHLICSVAVVP